MEKIIIGDVTPYQSRIAILEDGVATQLFYERSLEKKIVGNIYMGKVTNVLPGMQSAFVDIGIGKDVFLQAGDMDFVLEEGERMDSVKIQDHLRVGDVIPIQIIKDAIRQKGARASTCLALPGRYTVLLPSMKHIGISRKISPDRERHRLQRIARETLPEGMGLIFRTISDGMPESQLKGDIQALLDTHRSISENLKTAREMTLVYEEWPLIMKIARDYFTDDVRRFVLNSKSEYEKIRKSCHFLTPFQMASLELDEKSDNLFEKFGLEKEIQNAITPKVWLPSGGYLIIQPTEALVTIDVNTGKFTGRNNLAQTVYQTNLSAIKEIARQIRLRNLSGIIIIDFIDMQNEGHKRDIVSKLRGEFEKDPVKTQIFELTDLGLVQMTRHRTGKALSRVILEDCPHCEGKGQIFSREYTTCKVLGELSRLTASRKSHRGQIRVELHPTVADFVRTNFNDLLKEYSDRHHCRIKIVSNDDFAFDQSGITTGRDERERGGDSPPQNHPDGDPATIDTTSASPENPSASPEPVTEPETHEA